MTLLDSDSRTLNLTRAQLDVWMAHQLFPDPSVLNVPVIVDISASLNLQALTQAFATQVASTDVLRTIIVEKNGQPVATVLPAIDASIEVVDLRSADCDRAVEEWVTERVAHPMRLDRRLFDIAILRLTASSKSETVLYFNLHHIASDAWSLRLLVNSLSNLYERALAGDLPPVVTLPQFADYVDYDATQRASDNYERAKQFWHEFRKEVVPPPSLYGRVPREQAGSVASVFCSLGTQRSAALCRVAERFTVAGESPNRALLAILTASLAACQWRVSSASTLAIGLPYHNRPPKFRDTPGMFVNVVPINVRVADNVRFDELITTVQNDMRQAFLYGHYPLAHSMHAPLYHSWVNYHIRQAATFAGCPAEHRLLTARNFQECLGLSVHREADTNAFSFRFSFDGDTFPRDQCRAAVQHFVHMVDACVDNPRQAISEPDIVTKRERRQLLAWSRGERLETDAASCLDLIEGRARETPAAVAIVDGERSIGYRDMVSRAAAFARRLADAGVTNGTPVGMLTDRSIEGVTAILGVLMAGGAYLPLDATWPETRLSFILQNAGARHVVSSRAASHRVAAIAPDGVAVSWDALENDRSAPDRNVSSPERTQTAYLIFTSGSSGQPKGVAVSHLALLNHALASIRAYGLTPTDRVMQFHALTFDASLEEMFPAWCAGATVVLRPPEVVVDFEALERFIVERNVTVVDLPTSYWHEWTRMLLRRNAEWPANVRILIVGGEQPSAQVYANWRRIAGETVRWVNGYGPTEAAVTSTVFEAAHKTIDDPIPMGRPVANASAYVLDEHRRPMPVGVPGELYLGGRGLANGYVNGAELTEERFVRSDVPDVPGRLYRTGDLARMRDDGQLVYLGRVDNQVKVRGYRIEPGEIEQVLGRCNDISQCTVVTRDDRGGDKRLIAYVVPAASQPIVDVAAIRDYLRERLPEYMIPSVIVALKTLPLTASGKVDRAALPDPAGMESHPAPSSVPPRNGVEEALVKIWADMLGYRPVGVHDDFFLSGGDSLMTVGMICEIERALGVSLTVRDVYQNPTLSKLATVVLQRQGKRKRASGVIQMQEGSARPAIFFIYASSWELRLARLLTPKWPIYGIEVPLLRKWALAASHCRASDMPTMQELVAPFVAALRAHPDAPGCVLAGFSFGGLIAFEMAHQVHLQGGEVEMVMLLDSRPQGPGVRTLFTQSLRQARNGQSGSSAGLRRSWRQLRKRIADETDRALSFVKPVSLSGETEEAGWFTGVYDEEGRYVSSKLLVRLYARAERSYRRRPVDCPGVLFRAEDAPGEYVHDVDGCLGWKGLFRNGLDVIPVAGDHRAMIENEINALALAQQINTVLETLPHRSTGAAAVARGDAARGLVLGVGGV